MNFAGKNIHMIGIKGVGMAALCELLLSFGAKITGSDIQEEFHTDAVLKRLGIKPLNFDAGNIRPDIDLVVYSSAYPESHPERQTAKKLGLPQASYAEVLARVFNQKKGIMVAGSHGKTTTCALLGHILVKAGFDPTVVVGGTVVAWDSNVRLGKSDWMVIEGDEYQKKFLNFKPNYLLITNIDYDHPDTFPDAASYRAAFEKLKRQTKEKVFTLPAQGGSAFGGKLFHSDYLVGEHNRLNLSLVLALAKELGIIDEDIKNGVSEFRGARRRMEIYSQKDELIIIDDYAHHPAEIKATLSALKERWPDWQIKVVFQPHTYSRTRALLDDFSRAFENADEVILLPTYSSAREKETAGQNIDEALYQELKKRHKAASFGLKYPEKLIDPGKKTIIITMGAGDVWQVARKLQNLV